MRGDRHRLSDDPSRRWRGRTAFACLAAAALAGISVPVPGAAAPAGGGAAGRLEGSVVVGPRLSARKIRFNLYPDPAQPAAAPEPPAAGSELGNVILFFEAAPGLDGAARPRTARPVMRQEGLTFVPHVLAIPKGSTVDFP